MDVFLYARNDYVAIAIRANCGSVWQYNPPFSIKYDILSKPKANSKQPESSEPGAKNRELWKISIIQIWISSNRILI